MKPIEYVRRYAVFLFSLFLTVLGVCLALKSRLGNSPASSLVYVENLIIPSISLGVFTVIYNLVLILAQILVLRRKYQPIQLLQIPMSLILGGFTDLVMALLQFLTPQGYLFQLITLLLGCVIMACGVSLAVRADVLMNSGEALVRAVSRVTGGSFGTLKVIFDCFIVSCSVVLSLVVLGRVEGVREGTVITALSVGFLAKLIIPHLDWLERWMKTGSTRTAGEEKHE